MPQTQPTPSRQLLRAIGRWSLTALVINSIIGSGVFGLPSTVAGYLGKRSPLAILLAHEHERRAGTGEEQQLGEPLRARVDDRRQPFTARPVDPNNKFS